MIKHGEEEKELRLDDFDLSIWRKCLDVASKNDEIRELKGTVNFLLQQISDLSGKITNI